MKRKIVLIASLAAGVAAAILAHVCFQAKEAEVAAMKASIMKHYGGPMDVLIFAHDTPAGTVLQKSDFLKMEVPAGGMRGQALTEEDVNDVIGRKTLLTHKYKDIVFWADIEGGDQSTRGLSADIKRNMRAISVNCSGAASVSSMVRPNDHVDVIGTFDFDGNAGRKDFVTCTILQNVLVLATGSQTGKSRTRELGGAGGYTTVTLEVTPREAEMLAFANEIKGRIVLTLRNRNDSSFEKELPKVDFEKIRSEIEELNLKRQQQKLTGH